MKVEFVSYSGKHPSLCIGLLVVKINGKQVSFGYGGDYRTFWESGGCAGVDDELDEFCTEGDWILEADRASYTDEIWELMPKLIKVMNDNVEHGCCGGCI